MVILIAESKTMLPSEEAVDQILYKSGSPIYGEIADKIMLGLRSLSTVELAEETKLSRSLAQKLQKNVYEFPYKNTGNRAIEAYTGVVFKALDYKSLTEEARCRCNRDVRIISSLYGWLRPDDFIKTYRLDFNTRLDAEPTAGKSLSVFWRRDVTMALVKHIQEIAAKEILVLLPGDAANCVDWKLVKKFAKVWKADFREIREDGTYKTPAAGKLKTMRGKLLRQILEQDLREVKDLLYIESGDYFCEGTPVYPDHLSFLC